MNMTYDSENRQEFTQEEGEKKQNDVKVRLNLAHSQEVLQTFGLLKKGESLPGITDEAQIKAIAEKFTLVAHPTEQKLDGIEITLEQLQHLIAKPTLEEIRREALNPDLKKRRIFEQKQLLYTISQEFGQKSNLSNSMYILEKISSLTSALGEFQQKALVENFSKFTQARPDAENNYAMVSELLDIYEKMGQEEGLTEQDFIQSDEMKGISKEEYKDYKAQDGSNTDAKSGLPNTKSRIIEMRRLKKYQLEQIEAGENFLKNKNTLEALKLRAQQIGAEFPEIFQNALNSLRENQ